MSSEPPPGRWRVVEKGRRLVVIDTMTGEAATREAPPPPVSMAPASARSLLPSGPQQTSFDGRATLETHPIYDLKGPRTIELPPSAAAFLGWLRTGGAVGAAVYVAAVVFQPWLLVLPPLILFQPKLLGGLRRSATRWLDRYDTGASAG